ncbi:uncharacterized protein LY89DRAFT_688662 [Mollisia scopiformis]|uniref:Zn(2)-C6 fungal-type domain-containing protein n=1 Tax=Mollisia scopiformis TaxID=149040 RepID=A0A194WW65_MOLSC|nr:uncharacterized protein LY89DRAFT_688662 [Mollisia scopiformis]KUJ12210.1 hypothetical protein LY89DRAFT_688662 [Mollisia scopiformis]
MNSLEHDDTGASSTQAKPCTTCRRRKVKCDKVRPACSNCARTKQVCIYDTSDGRNEGSSSLSSDNELRERLARLEQLMATMMMSDNVTSRGSPEVPNQPLSQSAVSLTSSNPPPPTQQPNTPVQLLKGDIPTGHIVFQEGFSGYYEPDFWPTLIAEVEDLRQLFDDDSNEETKWASYSAVGIPPPMSEPDLPLAHPTIEESNILCKYFFECVNPFIRITHQGLFARELKEYRRGTFHHLHEFEALLFAIYTLTIGCLRPEVVEQACSCSKDVLLARFRHSTQLALAKINFLQSNKVYALSSLLHYITFLFQQNIYREGVALLGSAVHLARNLAIHKDPGHFPFSPWVHEIRRRGWNHLCVLDAIALSSYGAESCLPVTSDSKPPQNANDSDWHASRFAKPSSVPSSSVGFKEMTFALVHRELGDMSRGLSSVICRNFNQKEHLVSQVEESLTQRYLNIMDTSTPSQSIIVALVQVRIASARLSIRYRRSEGSRTERKKVYMSALELLEAYEYHSAAYSPFNWEWVFQSTIPWLALAIVLTETPKAEEQLEIERAQLQIEAYFQRLSYAPVASTPMWRMLTRLRAHMREDSSPPHIPTSSVTSSMNHSPASRGVSATLVFTDDLMMDFGNGRVVGDRSWHNDQQILQGRQDFPWLDTQMQFAGGEFEGYNNEQRQQ